MINGLLENLKENGFDVLLNKKYRMNKIDPFTLAGPVDLDFIRFQKNDVNFTIGIMKYADS